MSDEHGYSQDQQDAYAQGQADATTYTGPDGQSYSSEAEYQYYQDIAELVDLQQQTISSMEASYAEANDIARGELDISTRQVALAEERYQYWLDNFEPIEAGLIAEAKAGIDSEAVADRAGSNVIQAYDATDGALNRYYERLGLDTGSGTADTISRDMEFAKTAAEVGARNTARVAADEESEQMTLAIAAMGAGVTTDSLSSFTASAKSIADAAQSQYAGEAGVASANISAIGEQAEAATAADNAISGYNQFVAQANYNQGIDAANTTAQAWQTAGQAAGTGLGYAATRPKKQTSGGTNQYIGLGIGSQYGGLA